MKVQLALVCMTRSAFHWLGWLRQANPNLLWSQFSKDLLHHYGGDIRANPYERLATIHEEASVDEYIDAFIELLAQIERLTSNNP